jgi:hypothetical protein
LRLLEVHFALTQQLLCRWEKADKRCAQVKQEG